MTTFTGAAIAAFTLVVVGIGALWHPTEITGATVIIGLIILMLGIGIGKDLQRIEMRLCGSSDHEHDDKIEQQADRESEGYWKRLKRLEAENEKLPKMETWDIATIPNWDQYVIEQGENLRDLLGRMFTYSSAQEVPMNYELAYELAEYAHQKNALEAKSTEWELKRIEVLGLMRKREFSFKAIVDGEQELHELEKQVAVIEEQLRNSRNKIWVEYDRIKARVERERG
jgi:hypothetical protein